MRTQYNLKLFKIWFSFVLSVWPIILIISCTAPKLEAIPEFRQGVVTANQQTMAAFLNINDMLRKQQLDRAAHQPRLNEETFAEAIPSESRATWMRAFSLMDEYAQKLELLLSTEQRKGIETELRGFGEKLSATQEEPLPEGVAAGFVKLGGLLVQIKTGQDALKIMREANPAIQDIFSTMSFAVGFSHEEGIRNTVWSAWTTALGGPQVEFLKAGNNFDQKRKIAEKYLNMLNERDVHDQLLSSLRLSFLNLGKTHAAMARGDQPSASRYIHLIQEEYNEFRKEMDKLSETRGKE